MIAGVHRMFGKKKKSKKVKDIKVNLEDIKEEVVDKIVPIPLLSVMELIAHVAVMHENVDKLEKKKIKEGLNALGEDLGGMIKDTLQPILLEHAKKRGDIKHDREVVPKLDTKELTYIG